MTREILFRGKPKRHGDYYCFSQIYKDECKDGFVYGSLIVSGERYYICFGTVGQKINCCVNNSICSVCEVIPESVGQYTGLTDKNGQKIFEDDIIRFQNDDGEYTDYVVYWDENGWAITDSYKDNQYGAWKDNLDKFVTEYSQVIGNIHDNPELLEEKR